MSLDSNWILLLLWSEWRLGCVRCMGAAPILVCLPCIPCLVNTLCLHHRPKVPGGSQILYPHCSPFSFKMQPREWRRGWNIPFLPLPTKGNDEVPANRCLALRRHVEMRWNVKKSFVKWKSLYSWWEYFFLAHKSYTYFLSQVLPLSSLVKFDCSKVCVATQE